MIESAENDRWVARIASGDSAAVTELHDRFSSRVYFVALREMRSPADAEDVRNETMVRVLEAIRRDRLASASTQAATACPTPSGRWVALGLTGHGGTRWDVANLGCARIATADAGSAALTPDTVRDWAVRGVTAYVSAPRGGDDLLQKYFRAPAS